MSWLARTVSQMFDRGYIRLHGREKRCRVTRIPDLFDGTAHTPDSFNAVYNHGFTDPTSFWDLRGTTALEPLEWRPVVNGYASEQRRYTFRSPVATPHPENNLVPFTWFLGQKRSPVVLLFVPGWGRRHQGREEDLCRRLAGHGIDAGLVTLPYHLARTPAGAESGEYFISQNVWWTAENFRQTVAELRLLIRFMRERYRYVGLIGMSSGGFQARLAADVEEVDFLLPFISGARLGSIVWHGLITQQIRREMEKAGITEESLNLAWSLSDQIHLGRFCRARWQKHYLSAYDQVVPTRHQLALLEALGRPEHRLLPCAHYSSYFLFTQVMDDLAAFVRHCLPA